MTKRNMSQPQINRRKKVGAELTRTTSAIGLGSLAALGASAGTKKFAGGRLLPKVNPAKAERIHNKVKDKLFVTGLVSSGIGGANGFNNASWQSAEARQRKKAVVAKSEPSPFEDGIYGSETFAKGIGDWKTIDQREQSQRRSRKTMRAAGAAAGVGATAAAIGLRGGGGKGAANAAKISAMHLKGKPSSASFKAIGRTVKYHAGNPDSAAVLGGGAVVGGAAAVGAGAKGHHTYQQHKINQRRRANFKKDAASAFGVVHD